MRLVLKVERDSVHLTIVKGPRAIWHSSRELTTEIAVAEAVRDLLAVAPIVKSLRRPRVALVLSDRFSQVRRIEGLPALPRLHELTELVRENPFTFFLRSSARVAVADLHRDKTGAIWGAAFDADLIDELIALAALNGRHIDRVASSATFALEDGAQPPSGPRLGVDRPLVWFPPERVRRQAHGRTAAMCVITAALAAMAWLAPAIHARETLRRVGAERSRTEVMRRDAAHALDEIQHASVALDDIARVDANRGRATRLLVTLAATLPDSATIVSLRIDPTDATLVVTVPRVGEVLDRLAASRLMSDVRLIGPMTGGVGIDPTLARATIRGRLTAPRVR